MQDAPLADPPVICANCAYFNDTAAPFIALNSQMGRVAPPPPGPDRYQCSAPAFANPDGVDFVTGKSIPRPTLCKVRNANGNCHGYKPAPEVPPDVAEGVAAIGKLFDDFNQLLGSIPFFRFTRKP